MFPSSTDKGKGKDIITKSRAKLVEDEMDLAYIDLAHSDNDNDDKDEIAEEETAGEEEDKPKAK